MIQGHSLINFKNNNIRRYHIYNKYIYIYIYIYIYPVEIHYNKINNDLHIFIDAVSHVYGRLHNCCSQNAEEQQHPGRTRRPVVRVRSPQRREPSKRREAARGLHQQGWSYIPHHRVLQIRGLEVVLT